MSKFNGCALNFSGSKARHMAQVDTILPKEKDLLVLELFNGGGSLGSQLPESWHITANDIESRTIGLHQYLQLSAKLVKPEVMVARIKAFAHSYVDKTKSKEGYLRLVSDYNKFPSHIGLYALICSSFSNQIRFNSSGEFNLPEGKRYFNPSMEKKLLQYLKLLREKDITFTNKDFREFDYKEYDLVIADSPYYHTCAVYNSGWDFKDAISLMSRLDKHSHVGGKFIMFEELHSKGFANIPLIEWASKYNIKQLGASSTNCNYQRKQGKTQEVIIYNF